MDQNQYQLMYQNCQKAEQSLQQMKEHFYKNKSFLTVDKIKEFNKNIAKLEEKLNEQKQYLIKQKQILDNQVNIKIKK